MVRQFASWIGMEASAGQIAVLLFVMALFVRVVALVVMPDAHVSSNAIESILGGAHLILERRFIWNPDYPMLVPPLSALFVAAVQTVAGDSLVFVKLAQIVLDSATVILVFLIGRAIFGQACAVLGSGMLLLYPFAVFAPLYIGTEALFTFLLALFLFAFIKGLSDDRLWLLFVAGLALGLATLTRGTTLFLLVFFVPILWWQTSRYTHTRKLQLAALLIAGFFTILGPWIARNYLLHDAFIPSSTSNGPLLHGSSEDFWLIADREKNLPEFFDYLRDEKGIQGPASPTPTWVEKNDYYRRAAVEVYKERWNSDPVSFVPFLTKKFLRLWYGTETGNNQTLVAAINLPIYVLFLVGLWGLLREKLQASYILVALLLYFVTLHVLVFGYFRYMIPVMPYIILIAGYGLMGLRKGLPLKTVAGT